MSRIKTLIIPASILLVCVVLVYFITANPPQTQRRPPNEGPLITVQTTTINPVDYRVMLTSFGIVQPRTQSNLVAQVNGQIVKVSEQFRDGSFFEAGDPLIWIDDRDYIAEVKISQANVLSNKQRLLEEQARAEQALLDWQRLGDGTKPNALVLREPQLASAQAALLSAEAQLEKVELSLERATIRAPYAGRILNTSVDIGQVVNSNTQLASIYAIDVVDVRLPLSNNDLPLIDLPKTYRGNTVVDDNTRVYLHSDLMGKQSWLAKVVRTEGAISSDSQQLYVVAQIDDPYSQLNEQKMPLKIGQYVNADIVGKQLKNAIVVPNSAIYQGSYVYTVQNNTLLRKNITVRWQNSDEAIIETGLKTGDELVLTTLGQVSSGTRIQIQEPENDNDPARISTSAPMRDDANRSRPKRQSREELAEIAKSRGITVEELIEERKKRWAQK